MPGIQLLCLLLTGSTGQHMASHNGLTSHILAGGSHFARLGQELEVMPLARQS